MISNKHLDHLHEDVPGNYYDNAIATNLLQRFWHTSRFKAAKKLAAQTKASSVLDIGCHAGTFTSHIAAALPKAMITGIDLSKEAIAVAKKNHRHIKFLKAKAEKLPFTDKSFDLVTCFEMLEHIPQPDKVIKEMKRVMRKKGTLIVLVPYETPLFKLVWALWTKFGPGRIWKHTHVQEFKHDTLDHFLKKHGFSIKKRKTILLGMLLFIVAENV